MRDPVRTAKGNALLRLGWRRRRRTFREDGAQRHRVRRHAAHLRGLRPAEARAGLTPDELSTVFAEWNKGELDSYLIEISSIIFAKKDEDGTPIVDKILDTAARKAPASGR